uniref:Uncharacterized protein n=1 Tax=Plectus sambesii TaxID=2011161 RepID=A0A914WEL4_9BILA
MGRKYGGMRARWECVSDWLRRRPEEVARCVRRGPARGVWLRRSAQHAACRYHSAPSAARLRRPLTERVPSAAVRSISHSAQCPGLGRPVPPRFYPLSLSHSLSPLCRPLVRPLTSSFPCLSGGRWPCVTLDVGAAGVGLEFTGGQWVGRAGRRAPTGTSIDSDGPVRPPLTTQTVSLDASILFTSRRAAILFTGSAWHGADRRLSAVRPRGGQSRLRLLSCPADPVTSFQFPPPPPPPLPGRAVLVLTSSGRWAPSERRLLSCLSVEVRVIL